MAPRTKNESCPGIWIASFDHKPVPEHWLDRLCALGLLDWDALYQGPSIASPSCALVEYEISEKGRAALKAREGR